MIIKRMKAVFGVLEGESLELHEGLNVISAPNESGKSTWCAFIRAMLYGIDSSQREKNGVKPDKVKYAPWSGSPMSGEMDIQWNGRDITLSRRTKSANAPMREFTACYSGTAEPVAGLKGADAGETITGMKSAVFDSSVFLPQGRAQVENSAELEKRIAAIVSSGEEGVSCTQAEAQLRAWQRKRRHNRSGAIPAIEAEMAELEGSLEALRKGGAELEMLERRIEENGRCQAQLRCQAQAEQQVEKEQRLASVERSRDALDKAQQESRELRARQAQLKAESESGIFAGRDIQQAASELAEDTETLELEKKRAPAGVVFYLPLLSAVLLTAAGLALGIFSSVGLPLAGLIAMLVVLQLIFFYYKSRGSKAESMFRAKYGTDSAGAESILSRYERKLDALEEINEELAEAERREAGCREALQRAEAALLEDGADRAVRELERLGAEGSFLRSELSRIQGRSSALGDPMVMETELAGLRERKGELQREYDAIALALEVLASADEEMQSRFSPELGRQASEYMSALSAGRYERLLFDKELRPSAQLAGEVGQREKGFLSTGAADQIYLALRLAICRLALGEGESCPLILDDALVNFDGGRMAAAMELLKEIAKTRQVILFSCHDREKRYLAGE